MVQLIQRVRDNFTAFYQRFQVLVSIFVFCLGFLIDIFTIKRIDSLFNLVQQGTYLFILGILLVIEIKKETGRIKLDKEGSKWWKYHSLVVHFLFGSLLSLYTIFYYSSASLFTGLLFLLLLAGLMLANEIGKIREYGLPVRVILFSICLLSYFSFLYPIMMRQIGVLPFWMGVISSILILLLIWFLNFRDLRNLKKKVFLSALGIHVFFVVAYYTSLIPPVPVAIKKIGVYYSVEKREDQYIGKYLPEGIHFITKEFRVRPQDKINILISIFSPTNFQDQITLKWYRFDKEQGRKLEDSIPLYILGGREEGFRGYGSKQYYTEGDWEVLVETSDERELGRLRFKIVKDLSTKERVFEEDVF